MARVLFAALCLAIVVIAESKAVSDAALFKRFMTEHKKSYNNADELNTRFAIFKQNLQIMKELGQKNPEATFGINQFADLSPEEWRSKYLSKTPVVRDPTLPVAREYTPAELAAVPDTWDWRTKGAVTPVKNQGQCGSCWSFSTTGNIEGQWFLANHSLVSLSEQNLVDCDHECMTYENQQSCDDGCNGGLMPNAFTYVIKRGGIDTENSYPYLAYAQSTCEFSAANIGASISNFTMLSTDETQIAAYLYNNGPVSIAADAAEWQFYTGGVFRLPCGKQLDHGILLVGFGTAQTLTGKVPYWLVKNSWGATWGEQGYLRIERGKGECGLNTFACSSIV